MQQQRMSIAEWSTRMVMMMMMSTVIFLMPWVVVVVIVLYAGSASIWPQPIQSKAVETIMPPIFMILQVTTVVAVTTASPAIAAVLWNTRMPSWQCIWWRPGVNFFLLHSLQSVTLSNSVFAIDAAFGTNMMEWRGQTTTPAHGLPIITTTAALSSSLLCGLNLIPVNLVEYSIDSSNSSSSSHGDVYEDACSHARQQLDDTYWNAEEENNTDSIGETQQSNHNNASNKSCWLSSSSEECNHVCGTIWTTSWIACIHIITLSLQSSTATTTDNAQLPLHLNDEIWVIGGKYKGQLETFECRTLQCIKVNVPMVGRYQVCLKCEFVILHKRPMNAIPSITITSLLSVPTLPHVAMAGATTK